MPRFCIGKEVYTYTWVKIKPGKRKNNLNSNSSNHEKCKVRTTDTTIVHCRSTDLRIVRIYFCAPNFSPVTPGWADCSKRDVIDVVRLGVA